MSHYHDKKAELERNNLQYLRYYYGLNLNENINPHDAMSDVMVLEKLFEYYKQFYTIEEMIEISKQPILYRKMMFGKYKGQLFTQIMKKDKYYLKWMQKNVDMDENLKYTVNYYLTNQHEKD